MARAERKRAAARTERLAALRALGLQRAAAAAAPAGSLAAAASAGSEVLLALR